MIFRPDGRIYEGGWLKGKQHGVGWYQANDRSLKKKGIWDKGKRTKWLEEVYDDNK